MESAQRAGPVFTGNATVHETENGYKATLQLVPSAFNQNMVGENMQKALAAYLRSYFRANGWRVRGASFKRGYVELAFKAASSAASSASQKPRASF